MASVLKIVMLIRNPATCTALSEILSDGDSSVLPSGKHPMTLTVSTATWPSNSAYDKASSSYDSLDQYQTK